MQARHPGHCNLPQSVSGEDQRKNQSQRASGENPIQNHSQRACGESERSKATRVRGQREEHRRAALIVEQGERMKRTEESKANSRQSNQRTATETRRSTRRKRSKVQGETQYKARLRQPASPKASENRCRCPAGAGRRDRDHSKDRLQRSSNTSPEDREGSSQRRRLHDDSQQRNPDGQEATFSISQDRKTKSRMVFDSESRNDLSFTVQKDTEVIHREVKKEEQRSIVT